MGGSAQMKKITILFFLIFFVALGFCGEGAKIIFDTTEHDFGTVQMNKKVTHVFTFSNIGTSPLEITKIEAPCGCTSTLLSNKNIIPGEKGKLQVTLATGDYPTTLVRRVYVHTNDPDASMIKLIVKAKVQGK
jgi:hypothetical protein